MQQDVEVGPESEPESSIVVIIIVIIIIINIIIITIITIITTITIFTIITWGRTPMSGGRGRRGDGGRVPSS